MKIRVAINHTKLFKMFAKHGYMGEAGHKEQEQIFNIYKENTDMTAHRIYKIATLIWRYSVCKHDISEIADNIVKEATRTYIDWEV